MYQANYETIEPPQDGAEENTLDIHDSNDDFYNSSATTFEEEHVSGRIEEDLNDSPIISTSLNTIGYSSNDNQVMMMGSNDMNHDQSWKDKIQAIRGGGWREYINIVSICSFMTVTLCLAAVSFAFLIYPFVYVRDFSHTLVESSQIQLKPYYPLGFKPKGYIPKFSEATMKLTVPGNARFMMLSFVSNASVEAVIFRNTLTYYNQFVETTARTAYYTNQTQFIFENPLERSFFVISENYYATRFFATKILNHTSLEFDKTAMTNENKTELYIVWRNANLAPLENTITIDYWYRLEYDDYRETTSFTFAMLSFGTFILAATCVLLNTPTVSGIFSIVYNFLRNLLSFKTSLPKNGELHVIDNTLARGADIVFQNLSFVSFTDKIILHPTTGILKAGKLTAVMGQSGSSKSTFCNVLCGRASHGIQKGKVLINGKTFSGDTNNLVGFVTQDDVMAPHLTVKETLEFSCKIRKNKKNSEKVNYVMEKLGITKVQNSQTSVISGGERRRTSIGIEMVADTPIYILDEPSSGLDSESALSLCKTLREIAEENNSNIICVIHQPSCEILEQFHDIMLFREGRLLFHSPSLTVIQSLREHIPSHIIRNNPADEILRTLSTDSGVDIVNNIIKNTDPAIHSISRKLELDWKDMKTSPFYIHFYACFVRAIKQFYRDWRNLLFEIIISFVVGLLIGILFNGLEFIGSVSSSKYSRCPIEIRAGCMLPQSDTIAPYSSFLVLAIALISIMRGLRVFGFEIENFKRESYVGLNSWMYFLSKDLISIFVIAVISFSTTFGMLSALPHTNFFILYAIVFLTIMAGFPIGYTLSFFFDPQIAQLAAALVVVVFYSFGGNNPTIPEIEKLSPVLAYSHVVTYLRYIRGLIYMEELITRREDNDIESALKMNGYEIESISFYFYALFFWIVVFRYMAVYCMWAWKPSSLLSKINFLSRRLTGRLSTWFSNKVVQPLRMKMKRNNYKNVDSNQNIESRFTIKN